MLRFFYMIALIITSVVTMSMNTPQDDIEKAMCSLNTICSEFIQKYTKKYDLQEQIYDYRMPNEKLEEIRAVFLCYKPTSKAKARKIIVEYLQDLLKGINECKELQPFLNNHPFTVRNIDFAILLWDPSGREFVYPNLDSVGTCEGKIMFATNPREARGAPNQKSIEEEEFFEVSIELAKMED